MNGSAERPKLGWAAARPRVSVITIFLNAERFIEEAIDSVLAQDYGDLELILVDDGSAEACASLARSAADRFAPFVRYVQHDHGQNRGMSASRNLGLSVAQGEFVAFIDADDVWAPGKLRQQLAIMSAHPELDMVCGAVRYWYSWAGGTDSVIQTGHVRDCVVAPPEATLALYPLGTAPAPCPSDLLLRRAAVTAIGGFEEHFTGANQMYEDQAFLAKLYLRSSVYFSSEVWLSYRQHADSCVAEVTRTGRYREVRRYFLSWFEGYLTRQPKRSLRVRAALERAKFADAHPQLLRAAQLGKRAARKARQLVRASLKS
jgi:glycosyltransferase involved in cell wall biosynthesis